jgi:hypothetical protein
VRDATKEEPSLAPQAKFEWLKTKVDRGAREIHGKYRYFTSFFSCDDRFVSDREMVSIGTVTRLDERRMRALALS